MNRELIRKTLESAGGQEIKSYLVMKLAELRDIENVPHEADVAVCFLGQKRAYQKVKEILEEIDIKEEIEEERNSYTVL